MLCTVRGRSRKCLCVLYVLFGHGSLFVLLVVCARQAGERVPEECGGVSTRLFPTLLATDSGASVEPDELCPPLVRAVPGAYNDASINSDHCAATAANDHAINCAFVDANERVVANSGAFTFGANCTSSLHTDCVAHAHVANGSAERCSSDTCTIAIAGFLADGSGFGANADSEYNTAWNPHHDPEHVAIGRRAAGAS